MGVKIVTGADSRTWSVRRNVEWRPPPTGDEFEHDVDGGRGAIVLIASALALFWMVLFLWAPTQVHVPWYLLLVALGVALFFPVRWVTRRPQTLVAETTGDLRAGMEPERWVGLVRGRARANEETRVLVRNLKTRGVPGYGDSPLQKVN
jgi:hypothetical protein